MCIYTYIYIQKKKQNFYYLELCVLRTWIGNYEVGDPKMWLDREVGWFFSQGPTKLLSDLRVLTTQIMITMKQGA